jgi:hypothetical protein
VLITNFNKGGQYLIPVLLAIVIVIFQQVYINLVSKLFVYIGYLKHFDDVDLFKTKQIQVKKNIDGYWNCIKGIDQKRWYAQEIHD